jgi:hypothetical protein
MLLVRTLACLALGVLLARAQPTAAAQPTAPAPAHVVVPARAGEAPRLDGRLDDPIWRDAARIDTFVQQSPRDGLPATERTQVWIAYDSDALHFAFYAHYSNPALVRANLADRDDIGDDDTIAVYFDTFADRQRAFTFAVNGYGVQADGIVDASGEQDDSWDALFDARATRVDDGWIVEMRVPFKSLRYPAKPAGEAHRWGFQIKRTIEGKDEEIVWAPVSRDVQGFLTQMGVLHGFTDISTSRNLEILPTVTAVRSGVLEDDTGRFDAGAVEPDAGVSLKYGPSPNLTVDFAYNPDFSQIESDRPQIDVNERFALFYEEKRPFFLEGREIFDTALSLVHTRTIVDPRYGAKLTGKAGHTTVGLLIANDEAPGRRVDQFDPAFDRSATFAIGRVRYDLYAESYVGAILTDREFLDGFNRVAGVDGRFRLGPNHRLNLMAATSSRRDGLGRASSGPAFHASLDRDGRHLSYSVEHTSYAPGFHTDSGFVPRVDTAETEIEMEYTWRPERTVISWGPEVEYSRNYDFDGVLHDEALRLGLDVQFARNIFVFSGVSREMERFEGIDFDKNEYSIGADLAFSRHFAIEAEWSWGDDVRYDEAPFLGRGTSAELSLTLRPTRRLQSNWTADLSRMTRRDTGAEVFDVRVFRTLTTYQFSQRLLVRGIVEFDTWDGTLGSNALLTYRINAGTVAFLGFDDRRQRGVLLDDRFFQTRRLEPTSRTVFFKVAYLFRY